MADTRVETEDRELPSLIARETVIYALTATRRTNHGAHLTLSLLVVMATLSRLRRRRMQEAMQKHRGER